MKLFWTLGPHAVYFDLTILVFMFVVLLYYYIHLLSCLPACCQDLAATRLREHPTIPPSATPDAVDAGEAWPAAFCAFQGCRWEEFDGDEAELERHLREKHGEELEPICQCMLRGKAPDALRSVYNEAISVKGRQQAPIAGASLDRTALRTLTKAMQDDKVEALICFSCGNIHPYVDEVADKGDIKWHQPVQRSDATGELLFLDQPLEKIQKLLGLQVYLGRYDAVEPRQDVKLTDHESFEDWQLKLPDLDDGVLLCCPEDPVSHAPLIATYSNIRNL